MAENDRGTFASGLVEMVRERTGAELAGVRALTKFDVTELIRDLDVATNTLLEIERIPEEMRPQNVKSQHLFNCGEVTVLNSVLTLLGQEEVVQAITRRAEATREDRRRESAVVTSD